MCGKEGRLTLAEVDGAELNLCPGCAKYGKIKKTGNKNNFQFSKNNNFKRKFNNKEIPEIGIINNFSEIIRKAREEKGMSQEDFAKFLNERESLIHKWENGSLKPRIGIAKKMGRILNINLLEKEAKSKNDNDDKELNTKNIKNREEFTLGDFIKVRKRK